MVHKFITMKRSIGLIAVASIMLLGLAGCSAKQVPLDKDMPVAADSSDSAVMEDSIIASDSRVVDVKKLQNTRSGISYGKKAVIVVDGGEALSAATAQSVLEAIWTNSNIKLSDICLIAVSSEDWETSINVENAARDLVGDDGYVGCGASGATFLPAALQSLLN